MHTTETITEVRKRLKEVKRPVGFVPTMGYLHEGHRSLLRRAREENRTVVLSIFVNPLQFGPQEDLQRYPRDLARDTAIAETEGVDVLFVPAVHEMYPRPTLTSVSLEALDQTLCAASRPGHFRGVATVVCKLFNIIQPDRAYFGQKDAQQLAIIQTMVEDLNLPVTVTPCPIIREADGLAMSSRNVYLSSEERKQASVLYETLQWVEQEIAAGEKNSKRLIQGMKQRLLSRPLIRIDYVAVVGYPDLQPLATIRGNTLIALAVHIGRTRLIDNTLLRLEEV